MAPKLLASCCSRPRTIPRQNGSVFIGTFLNSRQFYGGILEMRLLAHGIPSGYGQFVGSAVGLSVPITKVERNENMSRLDISHSRPSFNFTPSRYHLDQISPGNPMRSEEHTSE